MRRGRPPSGTRPPNRRAAADRGPVSTRRQCTFATLQNKESIKELYGSIAEKIANRPGGYTRIRKLSASRAGDNADMCVIELVDFNEVYQPKEVEEKKTRRSRRGGKKATDAPVAETAAPVAAEVVEETPAATPAEEAPEAPATEEPAADSEETKAE